MAVAAEVSCGLEVGLDVPHILVPEIWALDYDETLGDTATVMDRLHSVASEFGISSDELLREQHLVESKGRSFNAFTFIKGYLEHQAQGQDRFDTFGQAFLDAPGPHLMFDDAPVLLKCLQDAAAPTPHAILTYGEGTSRADLLFQAVKVAASGYQGRAELTLNRDKGPQIERWFGPNDAYDFMATNARDELVAVFHAQHAILVDDKASSLENLGRRAGGVLLVRPGRPRTPRQGFEVPESVADRAYIAGSLGDIAVSSSYHFAGCSPHSDLSQIVDITGFRPVQASPENPNIYVYPGMSFQELRAAVEDLALPA